MSLTEKEAEKKSCPFTFNVEKEDAEFYMCIGSQCMSWKWDSCGGKMINWTGHCHLIYRPCGGAE